ncbi:hypothetical protein MUA02_10495 [Enterobacteriaceae bacterium H20N1]|uniref:Uncharacterized protein n=1 Tax=Dryocola boscaweniae TaxID=2925397 RepID=A0A9X2W7S8_9ENTR|nr:hypothetical protein [Dryocola boscaweniae]MCT4702091.1 hypothetical protein [Dryocola boscaweniae]MCT4719465.1 hypothetical protein [Dryocola boscaweniae]
MQEFWEIFGSAHFVAIAWACTVVSCIYAFVQKNNVTNIKHKFNDLNITHNDLKVQNNTLQQNNASLEISNNELKIQNTSLEQKIIKFEQNDIHDNYQEVHQHGKNNFNQGVIKGDFIYNK